MIDICEFAVGLSRQLYGRTISSERPGHRLMETWHPLGVVGVISAFNFPVAVWSWNTALALVCGDPVVWKPSELAPLTALASAALLDRAIAEQGAPEGLSQLRRRRLGGGRGARRPPGDRAAQRDRVDPHGARGRPAGRRPVRPLAARARRQQRRRRHAVGGPRPGHPRHRVLGGRHRGPALHDDAPRARARGRDRRGHRPGGRRLPAAADRVAGGERDAGRAADRPPGVRGDAGGARGGAGAGREARRRRRTALRGRGPRRLLRRAGRRPDARPDRRRRSARRSRRSSTCCRTARSTRRSR